MKAIALKLTALVLLSLAATSAWAGNKKPAAPAAEKPAMHLITVHKSATCGCCVLWVEHLRAEGFKVEVRDEENMDAVKVAFGIPASKRSCHTAKVAGYFIEGHVPASDIKTLLVKKPKAKGLVLPGMPMGSPGMETPDGRKQPYTVEIVAKDGTTSAFATH